MQKNTLSILMGCVCLTVSAQAQLTPQQKQQEMLQLMQTFNRNYAPYEWKRELFGFDMLNARPWLEKAAATRTDLDFADLLTSYTTQLRDGHVFFSIPSTFNVSIGIGVDIYDDKLLIESINRARLPAATYPFVRGDEIVSFDGKDIKLVLDELEPYGYHQGNPKARRRTAADYLFFRTQQRIPLAPNTPESAKVGVRLAATGAVQEFDIPWVRTGEPITDFGKLPELQMARASQQPFAQTFAQDEEGNSPKWMQDFLELNHASAPSFGAEFLPEEDRQFHGVLGYGSLTPVWQPPSDFVLRLGRVASDNFITGWYTSGGKRIGYIRFGRMSPVTTLAAAYQQLDEEVVWMQANTDGLVVDVMRNTGGFIVYGHELARRFIPQAFEGVGFEMRASSNIVQSFANFLLSARNSNAPDWVISLYGRLLDDVRTANRENRGRTGPVAIDNYWTQWTPATNAAGQVIAYQKPMIVLIDEFSVSTADLFPAVIQDAGRCKLVGIRSGGLGGTNTSYLGTTITGGNAGVTLGLMVRPKEQNVPGFPKTRYIETIGVQPDITLDYMTRDNLMQNGAPFVQAFTNILLQEIK